MKQLQLLHALLLHGTEILLMGGSQRRQYANGRLDDGSQRLHLSWLADACFDERHVGLFVEQPHGEGYANL